MNAPGSGTGAGHGGEGPGVRSGAVHSGEGPGVRNWSWRWACSHRGFVGQSKVRD